MEPAQRMKVVASSGVALGTSAHAFPTVEDGVLGVKFVDAVVESNQQAGAWVAATLDLH
jgi:hypothetical protein